MTAGYAHNRKVPADEYSDLPAHVRARIMVEADRQDRLYELLVQFGHMSGEQVDIDASLTTSERPSKRFEIALSSSVAGKLKHQKSKRGK